MRYFPLFVDLAQRRVVIVGGGEEALRKVRLVARSQARIDLIAERLDPELDGLVSHGAVSWASLKFEEKLLDGAAAVFVASDDETNTRVSAAARRRNIPVNVVDDAALSTFLVPSIVDRDPLVIAIGTEGSGPVLGQGVRAAIEAMLPPAIGALALRARGLRNKVAEALPAGAPRRDFWRRFFFGGLRDRFLAGEDAEFEAGVAEALSGRASGKRPVAVIGTGSGDPELMPLKAQRLLQDADVIVYDAAAKPFLDYARRDALYVATTAQDSVEARADRLVSDAAQGRVVVRLVAGDPALALPVLRECRLVSDLGGSIDLVRPAPAPAPLPAGIAFEPLRAAS